MSGPLDGHRIIEIAGIGPGPFAAMLLADMGAEVIRVERAGAVRGPAPDAAHPDISRRGRRNIAIDLKHPDGVATLLDLVERADALIEGFRPGVMERLGVGPDVCLERNPKLVYGRMTGWGQDGPYAQSAGHDINYISLAGALAHFGRAGGPPVPPMNMVGDFGGGGMFLAFGVVCALLEATRSGQGQVVDTAMVDGTATLMSMFWTMSQTGLHDETRRGVNLLDTGAHFYDTYECSDGEYVSIGSIEPQFYAELMRLTGLTDDPDFAEQMDRSQWPTLKERSGRPVPHQVAGRMVRDHGAHRRVLRAGAPDGGGGRASPQRRPWHLRGGRRDDATRAGAPIQPDGRHDRPAAGPRWAAHRRGAARLGPRRRIASTPSSPPARSSRPGEHTRLLPRPSGRRGDRDGWHDGARATAEGHRVVLVVATDGCVRGGAGRSRRW